LEGKQASWCPFAFVGATEQPDVFKRMVLLGALAVLIVACAPPKPAPAPTPTLVPTLLPSATPEPTPTTPALHPGEVEGLVMSEDGQLIIGVNWLSKSRVTYQVKGGDVESLRPFVGETVRLQGDIVDQSLWLKEITVRTVQASAAGERLSMRRGYIKELGPSIYMQGTHVLVDRDNQQVCLLGAVEGGPDLDQYMRGVVKVFGVLEKTVEGDAQIMRVRLVEPTP